MKNKLTRMFYKTKLSLKNGAPTILTCVGAVGVVATAVTAVKATPKAMMLLEEAEEIKEAELTTFEKVKVAGPAYIPSVLIGVSTISCIFGANVLNKKNQASLASAYAFLDTSYKEYKKKVADMLGEDAESEIRESIAKDHYKEQEIVVEDDKRLYYDECSGRYFNATKEEVLAAEYEVNRLMATRGYALLNDFYANLGLGRMDPGDTLGWSIEAGYEFYGYQWVEFEHTPVTMDDGLECTIISITHPAHVGYDYEI